MPTIDDLFVVHWARSGLPREYREGPVLYIGNSTKDNAVYRWVTPLAADRVFRCRAVVLSAMCDTTVQAPPFVACCRAGNGLVVLEPREPDDFWAAWLCSSLFQSGHQMAVQTGIGRSRKTG